MTDALQYRKYWVVKDGNLMMLKFMIISQGSHFV